MFRLEEAFKSNGMEIGALNWWKNISRGRTPGCLAEDEISSNFEACGG